MSRCRPQLDHSDCQTSAPDEVQKFSEDLAADCSQDIDQKNETIPSPSALTGIDEPSNFVPKLIEGLTDNDEVVREHYLRAIAMFCKKEKFVSDISKSEELMACLVRALSPLTTLSDNNEQLRVTRACLILYRISLDGNGKKFLIGNGGIPGLIHLLNRDSDKMTVAPCVLHNLLFCSKNANSEDRDIQERAKKAVHRADGMNILVKLQEHEDERVRRLADGCLRIMST